MFLPTLIVRNGRRSAHAVKVLEQRLITLGGGNVQRRLPFAILGVHIGAIVDQDTHHVHVPPSGGQMQGRVSIGRRCLTTKIVQKKERETLKICNIFIVLFLNMQITSPAEG